MTAPKFQMTLSESPKFIRFKKDSATSRIIHWEHPGGTVWRAVDCAGRDCPTCLRGDRVQQRFSVVVVHEGEERWLELPLAGWMVVLNRMEIMGERFYSTDFAVSRKRGGGFMPDYFFEPVPVGSKT